MTPVDAGRINPTPTESALNKTNQACPPCFVFEKNKGGGDGENRIEVIRGSDFLA